ncbi:TIM barrel protein [Kineosporia rhizophila]|uniref:bifunctional sugar phosphate isomerase/epimerase/4-hydroxyphenylpyruvate dioxygenase family protein n=1 Tax=Kineosporia rhizophila TaxID=84633 RepID=UPI001E3576B0|nr:sugar phosphate isomerase/epimerase and 4-hydroxyphenylpyruvate domain-containing protein [Kineosporia rhizophila]MCE0536153.1 TIM barrel protein [Kineosporia rhizophila]
MKRSIATVCLSGGLTEKLHACAEAGFDGVEVFEPDLVVAAQSPEEVRALADRLGLTLDLYQPFRDFEGVDPATLEDNLRRAEAKFALIRRLGMDLVLVCSNVATAVVDSDEVSAAQLRRLGELGARYGVRIAFEALAWGRFVDDYRRAWRIVELADHPNVGICLDSFHILSRGHDPAQIEEIPGEKIFFVQLADAPALSMDVLQWSRHHRLFPGEGSFDLATFVAHVLRTGYDGPLSLEVFNDVFRQTDVTRTAAHALRSLVWLEDAAALRLQDRTDLLRLPEAKAPTGFDFVEIRAEDTAAVETLLEQLGFTFRGRHRSKPVRLWSAGDARVVLNQEQARDRAPHLAAIGFDVDDPAATVDRAQQLMAPRVYRRTYASELPLQGVAAPDGTEIFLCDSTAGTDAPWVAEFEGGAEPGPSPTSPISPISRVDHVNMVQPWEDFDEAVLFYTSALGLDAETGVEVAGPHGLVRSQVMRSVEGAVRLPLNVAPAASSELAQHVAFACDDVAAVARSARAAGLRFLPVPANYYDDLAARYGLPDAVIADLRELDLLYERDAAGEFVHFYTRTEGDVFFEVVERRSRYDGYGAANAPVRLAAQSLGRGK